MKFSGTQSPVCQMPSRHPAEGKSWHVHVFGSRSPPRNHVTWAAASVLAMAIQRNTPRAEFSLLDSAVWSSPRTAGMQEPHRLGTSRTSATPPSTVHGTKWFRQKHLWNQIWQILTFLRVHFTLWKMGMEPNMTQNVVVENKLRLRMWMCLKTKDVFFKNLSLYTYFSIYMVAYIKYIHSSHGEH